MGTCLLIFSICFILQSCSASTSPKQWQSFPSAMVEGSVYCNTCFQQDFPNSGRFISGALVAVKCVEGIGRKKLRFQKVEKTNEHGVFRFRLPLELSKNLEALKTCSVKLVRSRESLCSVTSSETSSGLQLKSRRQGVSVFSAGFLACNHEPRLSKTMAKYSLLISRNRVRPALFFPPPIPFLPPPAIPFLPSPPIPFLPSPPNVGGIPLPPNPFQPPPSILPPLPFQPPPPPFIGIPPLPNIPPLPFFVPPPPPPPPFIPPLPFPPINPPLPFPPMFPPLPFPPISPGNPPPAAPTTIP